MVIGTAESLGMDQDKNEPFDVVSLHGPSGNLGLIRFFLPLFYQ